MLAHSSSSNPVFPSLSAFERAFAGALALVRKSLMLVGFFFIAMLLGLLLEHGSVPDGLRKLLAADPVPPAAAAIDESPVPPRLTQAMSQALEYVSRRYRVSSEALRPVFAAAQQSGEDLGLDPLLIVAVIAVESRFNPLSQSDFGAQGLMQLMPGFHRDKLPEDAGEQPFFDPITNVQIGARVLKDSIRRFGDIEKGLQQYGGALKDPQRRYAGKVLAEKQRLEQAVAPSRA